jgi:putative intracellular protease/amidase
MKIAALLFDKITILDIVGPAEVLSWIPDSEIMWVGAKKGTVTAEPTGLHCTIDHTLDEVTEADVLMIPGGPGVRLLLEDPAHLDWVRAIHETTDWTTSICTGSLLLGAAGLLDGLTATTHWLSAERLAGFGATYAEERVIPQGKIVTSAGVSSGIDMALWLLAQIEGEDAARAAQLCIEYDPQPPFDAGAPSKAGEATVNQARETVQAVLQRVLAA